MSVSLQHSALLSNTSRSDFTGGLLPEDAVHTMSHAYDRATFHTLHGIRAKPGSAQSSLQTSSNARAGVVFSTEPSSIAMA